MTRRNDKRNQRRNRKEDNASSIAASVLFGAIMHKLFGDTLGEKKEETKMKDIADEPFEGVRKVSDREIQSGVKVPTDGTAAEIPVPDGYQIFISEDGKPMIRSIMKDEPEKEHAEPSTYEDIAKELFLDKEMYFSSATDIKSITCRNPELAILPYNCTSEAQLKKLRAFCKLLNIAKYLNDGWEPDFDDTEYEKYFIYYQGGGYSFKDEEGDVLNFGISNSVDEPFYPSGAYFKTEKLARKAIDLMGEESLTDLFINNY